MVCAFNAWVFVAWPPAWDALLRGVWHSGGEIREHDHQLSSMIRVIRSHYRPQETVLFHSEEYLLFGLRHFQYALPEFDEYQMAPDGTVILPPGQEMWSVQAGRLEFVNRRHVNLTGKHTLLLVVPPGESIEIFAPYLSVAYARAVAGSGGTLFEYDAERTRARDPGPPHG